MRIDSHHSFAERYPLAHLGTILKRNRFDGSILVAPSFLAPVGEDFVLGVVLPLAEFGAHPQCRGVWCSLGGGIPGTLPELPVDVPAGAAGVAALAERFPDRRIAIGHPGGPPEDLERAARYPNVYCKLTPSPRECVRRAMQLFAPDRLMFGSRWPELLPEITWKASLAGFTQAIGAQTIEIREQLLGGTAAEFYGL